jgi:hypothetical protein
MATHWQSEPYCICGTKYLTWPQRLRKTSGWTGARMWLGWENATSMVDGSDKYLVDYQSAFSIECS